MDAFFREPFCAPAIPARPWINTEGDHFLPLVDRRSHWGVPAALTLERREGFAVRARLSWRHRPSPGNFAYGSRARAMALVIAMSGT